MDATAVEGSADGRLVDLQRRVEHFLPADIEQQIAKIVVPVGPGSAVVIEDAVARIGLRTDRQIVQAKIAMDQGPIGRIDRRLRIAR